jgi:intracellular septation protein A
MLALDIVGPLVVYRLCRGVGMAEVWALVVAGLPPGIGVLTDWLRWRTLEVVGSVVLAGIGLSIALALITNDTKVVLLEDAGLTAAFGLACLGSLATKRPLIFYFGQGFYGGRHSVEGAEMASDFDLYSEARFFWRTVTAVWGVTHIALALAVTLIVQTQSTGTALSFNRVVPWILTGALLVWSIWWGERLKAQKPPADE